MRKLANKKRKGNVMPRDSHGKPIIPPKVEKVKPAPQATEQKPAESAEKKRIEPNYTRKRH